MATHSSILAQRIPWTEESGGLLSIGSHRVGHDWSDLACMHALEKEMATHSSILAWTSFLPKNPEKNLPRSQQNRSSLFLLFLTFLNFFQPCFTLREVDKITILCFDKQVYKTHIQLRSLRISQELKFVSREYMFQTGLAKALNFRILASLY